MSTSASLGTLSSGSSGGVATTFGHGALSAGGEYGGIGSDFHIWTWRARGTVPF